MIILNATRWTMSVRPLMLCLLSTLALACAGARSTGPGAGSAEPGYQLAVLAVSCWYGGVWDDIENRPQARREEASQRRCHELARQVTGRDDPAFYEQVRATTDEAVARVV